MLLSTGERISAALCAMAIEDLGHHAVSLTGSQAGIVTDTVHTKAKIVDIRPKRIEQALEEGKIVLVAGFQGVSTALDVTTLGRGGSDTTAVALAAALGGDCEIYTDVEGVYTADPRIVPGARKLPVVSPLEMLEMAGSGATRAAAALGRVRPKPRRVDPRPLDVHRHHRHLDPRGRHDGRPDHLRHHPHRGRGLRHARERAGQARRRGRHLHRRRRRPHQRRHDHPERGHPRARGHHVLAAGRRPAADDQHDRRACAASSTWSSGSTTPPARSA